MDEFTRNQIYYLYKKNSDEWSIKKLAFKFKISTSRVDAIIDLKEHEEKLLQAGFQKDDSFISMMENAIGATGNRAKEVVKEVCDVWKKRSPTFVTLPEDRNLTFEEAARILNMPQKATAYNSDNDRLMDENEPIKVIQIDKHETNRRFVYFITDISKNKHPEVSFYDIIFSVGTQDYCKRKGWCAQRGQLN